MIVSFVCGAYLTYSHCKDEIKDIRSESERKSLKTIRDNYAKEQHNTKLLLEELGEVLDIDVVELPSFGYTILRGATKVEE
jgi:transcriptional regulatory protein LevR